MIQYFVLANLEFKSKNGEVYTSIHGSAFKEGRSDQ